MGYQETVVGNGVPEISAEPSVLRPDTYGVVDVARAKETGFLEVETDGLYVAQDRVHEGLTGPYIAVFDYGQAMVPLIQPTDPDHWPEGIVHHSVQNTTVQQASDNITLLANLGAQLGADYLDDPSLGALYAANFALVYTPAFEKVASEAQARAGNNWTLLSPLRGGEVVHLIAQALGYSPSIPRVRSSRVILDDGRYLVGIQAPENDNTIHPIIVFGDDCRAAAGSEDAMLRWAREKINVGAIFSAVGFGVKRASEILSRTWQDKAEYQSHVGAPANGMDSSYYLAVTHQEITAGLFPQHCVVRVNDMGRVMSLLDPERRAVIGPVIMAAATGELSAEQIFDATRTVIDDPSQLESQVRRF